jgi:hypothetical protein
MLKSAKDVLATGDVTAIVDFAIEANRRIASATEDLGVVKAYLRSLAEKEQGMNPALSRVLFEGHLGSAQVVIPTKVLFKARKGMKLGDLKKVLPAETYESLFTEKVIVEPSEDYEENSSALSPSQRLVVDKYVEGAPQTPRVSLPE